MNLKSILLVSALAFAGSANAVLATFNYSTFTANSNSSQLGVVSAAATSFDSNLSSIVFSTTAAGGLNTVTSGTADGSLGYFAGKTTGALVLVGNVGSSTSNPITNNGAYIQYVLSAGTGYDLSATSIAYDWRRSGTGANNLKLSVSTDGTNFTQVVEKSYTTSLSLFTSEAPITLSVTNASTLYVRFTYSGITGGAGSFRLDNLVIDGTTQVAAVPEPASMVALGLGAAAMIRRRRKA